MLDSYTFGKARRISPEAPVAVVHVQAEERHPGGSGNVILNLLSLGAHVIAVGRVGADWAGELLFNALKKEGVDVRMVVTQKGYCTPLKSRIIADNQQIVRVDHEELAPLSQALEQHMIDRLDDLMNGIQVVAISDYGKGGVTPTLIAAIIQRAKRLGIPVVTDPKGHDFRKYSGTTVIKPNLSEAYAAAKLPVTASLQDVAAILLLESQAELLMVTRSEAGISLFHRDGTRFDFPVHVREVKDVTGAGDTVLAMLAHAMANHMSYDEAAHLCNVAAGIAIEHIGCARVSLSDLALRLFQDNINNKIFDQDHVFVLEEILKKTSYSVLVLAHFDALTSMLFQSIKKIVVEEGKHLLVYLNESESSQTCREILSSLQEVSYIVTHFASLNALCESVPPHSVYLFHIEEDRLEKIETKSHSHWYQQVKALIKCK